MSPTRALLSLIFLISLLNAAPAWPLEKFPEKCDSANSSYRKAVLTKLNHFTLTHYGVPVPCPTLKHHC